MRNNYQSRNLIGLDHLGNKLKKFYFVHQTVSCREAHVGYRYKSEGASSVPMKSDMEICYPGLFSLGVQVHV